MTVKPIPETSPRVIPMLVCRNPEAEIEFCERVLQAEVGVRRPGPDGKTIHAALVLGEARIIIQAEFPQLASTAPELDGSSPVVIFVYVEDVDRAVEMTLAAGGSVLLPGSRSILGRPVSARHGSFRTRLDYCQPHSRHFGKAANRGLERHPERTGREMTERSATTKLCLQADVAPPCPRVFRRLCPLSETEQLCRDLCRT